MNPFVVDLAKKYDSYPKFLKHLITSGVIKSTTDAIKGEGFKGLKEFYKSVKRSIPA